MKKRPSESSTEEAVAAAVMKEEEAEVKTTTSPLDGGRTSSRLREKNPTYSKRGIVVSPSTSLASAAKALQNEKYDESEDQDSTKAKSDELVPTRRSNRDIQVSEEQASQSTDERPLKRLPGLLPCIYSISLTISFLVVMYLCIPENPNQGLGTYFLSTPQRSLLFAESIQGRIGQAHTQEPDPQHLHDGRLFDKARARLF